MAAQIADLGGRTLALGGGVFLLSEPLVIPPNYGNLNIADGTLRASEHFDKARYLIEIGSSTDCHPLLPSGKPDAQASCNEFVNVQNILFDASLVAAGGMRIAQTMMPSFASRIVGVDSWLPKRHLADCCRPSKPGKKKPATV